MGTELRTLLAERLLAWQFDPVTDEIRREEWDRCYEDADDYIAWMREAVAADPTFLEELGLEMLGWINGAKDSLIRENVGRISVFRVRPDA